MNATHEVTGQAEPLADVNRFTTNRASAWLVGEEGRGVPQILAMAALTRLDCALGTAGLMRQALSIALHQCAQRLAFGRALVDQPAMTAVLVDLALESEAATALALRLARAVDRTEHGQDPDGFEALMRRVLTPVATCRLDTAADVFGLLPADLPLRSLVARAMPADRA